MKITITTDKDFEQQYDKLYDKYGDEIMSLEGMSRDDLDITKFIDKFMSSDNVANASIDANANVTDKNMTIMKSESVKQYNKLLSRNKIYIKMKERFGKQDADNWLEEQINGALYEHDSHTSSFFPYCYAFSLRQVVDKGLFFITDMKGTPAKHLDTFNHHTLEFVSYATNQLSGAVGLPDYLIYAYYYWMNDIKTGYVSEKHATRYKRQKWQELLFSLNQPYLKGGEQSAYINLSILDRPHIKGFFSNQTFPDGSFIDEHIEELITYQKEFMEYEKELRKKKFFTFPVISASLKVNEDKTGYDDDDMFKYVSKHNLQWNDINIYNAENVDALASCCRLTSSRKDITEQNGGVLEGHFNSIGGTSISIGSIKVTTINLVRIALESKDFNEYMEILEQRVRTSHKYLAVQRAIIQTNIDKGLLPLYTNGLIDIENQFSTIGINGMYEAIKLLGGINNTASGVEYNDKGIVYAKHILDTINRLNKTTLKEFGFNANMEQVPAESCSIKLCKKDKILFGDKVGTNLYANQWIPLTETCSIFERIRVASILDKACGGGVMLHINLSEPFKTEEEAERLTKYILSKGVIYFSFISEISVCENEHSFFGKFCPICGKPVVDTYIKIVGYLVKTSSYHKERKKEMKQRVFYGVGDLVG